MKIISEYMFSVHKKTVCAGESYFLLSILPMNNYQKMFSEETCINNRGIH